MEFVERIGEVEGEREAAQYATRPMEPGEGGEGKKKNRGHMITSPVFFCVKK